jgi:pimeloyl-ACP methyl ester carboxylesterase
MDKRVQSPNSRGCLFCPDHEFGWHYQDVGHGPPLILLHGIGMSHFAWKSIINNLADERRVLAFDIAGFGMTPPVPDNIQPIPANLVTGAGSPGLLSRSSAKVSKTLLWAARRTSRTFDSQSPSVSAIGYSRQVRDCAGKFQRM